MLITPFLRFLYAKSRLFKEEVVPPLNINSTVEHVWGKSGSCGCSCLFCPFFQPGEWGRQRPNNLGTDDYVVCYLDGTRGASCICCGLWVM